MVACSSAEYGLVASKDLPVRETHPLLPLHPYGVSKVAQDLLAAQYYANYKIPAIRIRIFNTTGPGKKDDVCSDLTKRAIEIVLGIRPPLMKVGNTNTRRAIIDVRDQVEDFGWRQSIASRAKFRPRSRTHLFGRGDHRGDSFPSWGEIRARARTQPGSGLR